MWPIQFCFLIFYYMYGYLAACVHVYLLACQVPVETRRECWFETRVIGNHYPLCGSWDLNPGPQEEESVLLTTESSLSFFRQLLIDCFEFYFMHSTFCPCNLWAKRTWASCHGSCSGSRWVPWWVPLPTHLPLQWAIGLLPGRLLLPHHQYWLLPDLLRSPMVSRTIPFTCPSSPQMMYILGWANSKP